MLCCLSARHTQKTRPKLTALLQSDPKTHKSRRGGGETFPGAGPERTSSNKAFKGLIGAGKDYHTNRINAIAWDDKGTRLFTGDGDGNVCVWRADDYSDPRSYKLVRRVPNPALDGKAITSLSVSVGTPDLVRLV